MKLTLQRKWLSDRATIGELFVNGAFFCFALEDHLRALGVKVKGQTAIPAGSYQVVLTWSNRFQKVMPRLVNVPMFDGCLIHAGNTERDTAGCILVGRKHAENQISDSRAAFVDLYNLLAATVVREKIGIEIHNPPGWDAQSAPKLTQVVPVSAQIATLLPNPQPAPTSPAQAMLQAWPVRVPDSFSPPALGLLVRRALPFVSTATAGSAAQWFVPYKWPLFCAAAFTLGIYLGWFLREPERKIA